MWIRSYSKIYQGVAKEAVWKLWVDVNNWHRWDPDIDYGRLEDPFAVNNYFSFKPKGMSEIKLKLVDVDFMHKYTDFYRFFGASLYGTHEMEKTPQGLKLTTTIKVTGLLKFLWVKLVAQGIVDTLPEQMEALIKLAKSDTV